MNSRAFIRLRHECWFALRLFDKPFEQFVKAFLAHELLHRGDAEQLLLEWIEARVLDFLCNGIGTHVLSIAATFDELVAVPRFAG